MGKYLRVRAERQLTKSEIEIISTALQQYYDQTGGTFPPQVNSDGELATALAVTAVTVISPGGTHPTGSEGQRWWCSESLFYFLDRIPQSKAVLSGLSNRMLSNKDKTGIGLQVEIPTDGTTYDCVRFVDAWGMSLNYTYTAGDAFPVLTSAGPDKKFAVPPATEDDLRNQ
jgi:hypothetical protein